LDQLDPKTVLPAARGAGAKPQQGKEAKIFLSMGHDVEDYMAARRTALAANFSKFHKAPLSSKPAFVQVQAATAFDCIPERHQGYASTGVVTTAAELSGTATAIQSVGLGTSTAAMSSIAGSTVTTSLSTAVGSVTGERLLSGLAKAMKSMDVGTEATTRNIFVGTESESECVIVGTGTVTRSRFNGT
jgi:hypothetical protein